MSDESDCDDSSALALPGGLEVACDGLDNDCDGFTDVNGVPSLYPTIQEAIDTVADGAEICIAPGTYTESFDFGARQVTLVGGGGTDGTVFDLSTATLPMITAREGTGKGAAALRGFTVTGLDHTVTDTQTRFQGAFLHATNSAIHLEDMVFADNQLTMMDGTNADGGLLYTSEGSATLLDLEVQNFGIDFAGGSKAKEPIFNGVNGGLLHTPDPVDPGWPDRLRPRDHLHHQQSVSWGHRRIARPVRSGRLGPQSDGDRRRL